MQTVKILHCADIHIGAAESFLGSAAEQRRIEALLTFEKIIDLCIEKNVQVLAIAGDLFDSNLTENSLAEPVFEKIATAPNLKVIFAAGNHDPLNRQSPFKRFKLPENLFVLGIEEEVINFPELNLRVYGRSFETSYLEGKKAPTLIPPDDDVINLCVLHGELGNDLTSGYNTITKDFISASKMDYIALGHIHQRSQINKLGNTFYAYPGCPDGKGFDELGDKGVYIGEIGKGFCNLEFVSTAKRIHAYKKIDLSNITAETDLCDLILNSIKQEYGENFGDNLYKIELTGKVDPEIAINPAEIAARLADKVYYLKVKNCTHPKIDFETLSKENSLLGIFARKMCEKIKSADDETRKNYELALELGYKAFFSEVKYDDN
ncbi:MAG: metallophosphoesterase family protein [Acutalibacteraceae bacterium]|jgi:exonuclease SbcD